MDHGRLGTRTGQWRPRIIDEPEEVTYRWGSPAWWFTSRSTGRITVVQRPNLLLVLYVVAVVSEHLLHGHHPAARVAGDLGSAAIVLWALDEMARGVNPWRRLLGSVVLVVSVVSLLRR